MRILVFGDSIAHGQWDPAGGWVQRMRSAYDAQTTKNRDNITARPETYNLSVAGDTAEMLLRRIPLEIRARKKDGPLFVVVAIGMNDTMIYKGVEANTPDMYQEEVRQIAASIAPHTDKILFVGMNAVDEDRCCPWKYAPADMRFTNERIWLFEKALRSFCAGAGLPVVKVFEHFSAKNAEKNLLADGLHPNEAGHQLIAELAKPEVDKFII